ncbi:MAG: nuclear transport factor 2 family protein [Alphaproteobacteria bacterium]
MTSPTPTERVRKVYDDFARRDIAAIIAALTNDVTWIVHGPDGAGYFGRYAGKAGVARWAEQLAAHVVVDRLAIRRIVADGDWVVAIGDFAATALATGRGYQTAFAHVWQVRGDRIAAFEDFFDTTAAVAAAAGR